MNRQRHAEIVKAFAGRHVTVLGDLMLDEYTWGQVTRISPESPVMVVDVERESSVPGGAANVVNNLLALGASVSVIGVVGSDAAGETLRSHLQQEGADVSGVVADASRPTTRKTRIVAHSQQVLRVDHEQKHPVAPEVADHLLARLHAALERTDAIVVSDYLKGVITPYVATNALKAARERNVIVTANPKPRSARMLGGANVLQLNLTEAEQAAQGDTRFQRDDEIDEAGADLVEQLCVGTLVVTRGSKGISYWHRGGSSGHVPAHPVEVYDVAGAGDTVISALTLSMTAGASVTDAAHVANHAAACVVRKLGVATVTAEELLQDWALYAG